MQKLFLFIEALFSSRLKKAVSWRCSLKKMFLEISQNSQENTCARVSCLIKLQTCNLAYRKSGTQDPKAGPGTKNPRVGPENGTLR